MPGSVTRRSGSGKTDDPLNPETSIIMNELQDIRQKCEDEFKNLQKILQEKNNKENVFGSCIANELHDSQQKCKELTLKEEKYESEITALQESVKEKTEKVRKLERKLEQKRSEKDELRQLLEKEYVSKTEYTEVWEELVKQKKTNEDLLVLEEVSRNKVEKIVAEKKAVEKSKWELIKQKREDQDYFVKKIKELEAKIRSSHQAAVGHSYNSKLISHRSESTVPSKEYPSLEKRMRNEHSKYIPEKRPKRY